DGADYLYGGEGDDIIIGGAHSDQLYGGAGADRFVFSTGDGPNNIHDFQDGIDLIDISGYGGVYSSITQAANGAKITFTDGGFVTLIGFKATNLSSADFIGLSAPLPAEAPKDDWLL
ncbi:hypothetical protein GVN21_20240, partial [Caulobacter sp. SLTY]|uniref:M10 family metallopeptidase C-terminal domain-containing protein n=1 Tax=Caulobacter sp. SLTY TaxID=2683262 RepID=UPI00196A705A